MASVTCLGIFLNIVKPTKNVFQINVPSQIPKDDTWINAATLAGMKNVEPETTLTAATVAAALTCMSDSIRCQHALNNIGTPRIILARWEKLIQ